MMKKSGKPFLFVLAVIVGAILLYIVLRAVSEDETARLRRAIYAAEVFFEDKDTVRFAGFVSDAYSDNYGNTKIMVTKLLGDLFRDYEDVDAAIKQLQLDVSGGEAQGNIGIMCYFGKAGDSQVYSEALRIKADFRKIDGRWQVLKAEFLGDDDLWALQGTA